METLIKKISIKYWWTIDSDVSDIPEKHFEALEKDATERIFNQLKEGMTSGELITSVRFGKDLVPEESDDEGLEYSGWWEMTTESL